MRRTIKPAILMREAEKIECFKAMHVTITRAKKDKVYIKDIFDAYKDFLHQKGMEETPLTIDGFGRMIHLEKYRNRVKIGNEPQARGFVGVKLVYGDMKQ